MKKNVFLKYFLPSAALIISILSAYYAWSGNKVASESNKIAREAREVTENLFLAEKRPYINVYIHEISTSSYLDITTNNNNEVTALFSVDFKNEGGIPARDIGITIYFFDDQENVYNTMNVYMPDTQKILPGKTHGLNISTTDNKNTPTDKAIRSGELRFQIVINYKSDVDESIAYVTKKQFSISHDRVILIGNLGEFQ